MSDKIIDLGNGFWNIRGAFRIGGVLNIGTQTSLVRRQNGKFVLLDSYPLKGAVKTAVDELTDNGALIEAILNVHPFHTVHVTALHEAFPEAALYGTARHHENFPELPWRPERTEDEALWDQFSDDLDFTVPAGVDFISENSSVHFSSVLVYHAGSKTIHVDDTFMYLKLPLPMRVVSPFPRVTLHPTLHQALEKRAGASADFKAWMEEIIDRWGEADHLCAAHNAALTESAGRPIAKRLTRALKLAAPVLNGHRLRFG